MKAQFVGVSDPESREIGSGAESTNAWSTLNKRKLKDVDDNFNRNRAKIYLLKRETGQAFYSIQNRHN